MSILTLPLSVLAVVAGIYPSSIAFQLHIIFTRDKRASVNLLPYLVVSYALVAGVYLFLLPFSRLLVWNSGFIWFGIGLVCGPVLIFAEAVTSRLYLLLFRGIKAKGISLGG